MNRSDFPAGLTFNAVMVKDVVDGVMSMEGFDRLSVQIGFVTYALGYGDANGRRVTVHFPMVTLEAHDVLRKMLVVLGELSRCEIPHLEVLE